MCNLEETGKILCIYLDKYSISFHNNLIRIFSSDISDWLRRKTLRNRKSLVDSHERRKSRRHSTGNSPLSMSLNARLSPRLNSLGVSSLNNTLNSNLPDDDDESSSSQSSQGHLGEVQLNGSYKENKGNRLFYFFFSKSKIPILKI